MIQSEVTQVLFDGPNEASAERSGVSAYANYQRALTSLKKERLQRLRGMIGATVLTVVAYLPTLGSPTEFWT